MSKFSISNLDLYYDNGAFKALKNINLEIPANEITAFIGPSGCGKSTLLKSLNRMNDLVEGCKITGKVLLDGEDIYGDMNINLLRKRVGMVFQKPNPFPMSIYDNIAYGPRTHGIRSKVKLDDIVERSLRNAAIWDEVKDRLKLSALGMSGGQQQRLCIARALAVEPEVLLMDEPTSALDPISTSKIEDLAEELKKDYTIVMVTHNMQQAARISDKTAFFLLGEVIEYGETEQIFSMPKNKKTEDYIREVWLMRMHFDQQLEELNLELIKMGALCERAIRRAADQLLNEKENEPQAVERIEDEINHKERDIENLCMKLLLQQQPVAKDLRMISSALKMISDMERIGDQAQDIADMSRFVKVQEIAHKMNIGKMAEATIKMVTESIDSFVKKDLDSAAAVVKYDNVVDDLFLRVKTELPKLLQQDPQNAEYYIDLIMVAKYFERIGDHAENIAQWVEYSITGTHDE